MQDEFPPHFQAMPAIPVAGIFAGRIRRETCHRGGSRAIL